MSRESAFIDRLRPLATHPAARGLLDDAAVLGDLVLTHDMLVEGVHFLPDDPPVDVAWKLVAVNLSDLAAKGAEPVGALMGCGLGGDPGWDAGFAAGLDDALAHFALPLLGGDTVVMPAGAPRTLGLTAIGRSTCAPSRSAARAGDTLYVTGAIGLAGAGLAMAQGGAGQDAWLAAYRRPQPRLAAGRALAPLVHAMADVSDGLLIDAGRMAAASGLAVTVDIASMPVPEGLNRLAAATAGDDYELICAALALDVPALDVPLTAIGRFSPGTGLILADDGRPLPLPARLGWEHGAACPAGDPPP